MLTFAQFIQDYPEFANANQSQFNLNLNRASQHIIGNWGQLSPGTDPTQYTQADIGTELVIAHFLARAQFRAMQVANGGPAIARGNVSAESVGPGSVSYDVASATEEGAGHWNQTDYGREHIQMARLLWLLVMGVNTQGWGEQADKANAAVRTWEA
jgi:hypothetical protein